MNKLLLLLARTRQTQFYFDAVGGNDAAPGTPGSPKQTLAAASALLLQPGDAVWFNRATTFIGELHVSKSGTVANPITFGAYGSGALPILDNQMNDKNSEAVQVQASNIVLEYLNVKNTTPGAGVGIILQSGSNNVIGYCDLSGVGIAVVMQSSGSRVHHSAIHDLVLQQDGVGSYGALGVQISAATAEVDHNTLTNCMALTNQALYDGGAFEVWQVGDGATIHHNYTNNCCLLLEVGSDGSGSAVNMLLHHNVVWAHGDGFNEQLCFHNSGTYATVIDNCRVENNTIVYEPVTPHQASVLIAPDSDWGDANEFLFRNNAAWADIDNIAAANRATFTHTNNVYYAPTIGYALHATEKLITPIFANRATGDLRLRGVSYGVGVGADLGYTSDYDGITIPQGAVADMGAYEWDGTAPAILIADTFTRGDDANALGNAETGGTWIQGGTKKWGIYGNQASIAANEAYPFAYIDTGQSDVVVSCTVLADLTVSDRFSGLMFRGDGTSDNLWFAALFVTAALRRVYLRRRVAAGLTTVTYANVTANVGTTYPLKVVAVGSIIQVWWNNALIIDVVDANLVANTKHGLWTDTPQQRLDDFLCTSAGGL